MFGGREVFLKKQQGEGELFQKVKLRARRDSIIIGLAFEKLFQILLGDMARPYTVQNTPLSPPRFTQLGAPVKKVLFIKVFF